MKLKSLLQITLLLPVLLSTSVSHAQSVPITIGMDYGVARQRLIQAGWKPFVPKNSRKAWPQENEEDMRLQLALAAGFRQKGWYETRQCAPTGHGRCEQQFLGHNSRVLIVETTIAGSTPNHKVYNFWHQR